MKETVKRFNMSFSYEEKRKRQYEEYQKRKDTLRSMSKEERVFQYIKLNADYEYQKNIFNVLLAASVPLFLNLGFMFWNFMKFLRRTEDWKNTPSGKRTRSMPHC